MMLIPSIFATGVWCFSGGGEKGKPSPNSIFAIGRIKMKRDPKKKKDCLLFMFDTIPLKPSTNNPFNRTKNNNK